MSIIIPFRRDKHGQVEQYEQTLIEAIDTFRLPETWPREDHLCRALLTEAAQVAGAAVATSRITADHAYAALRHHCEGVRDSSMGRVRVQTTFPACAWWIDETTKRVAAHLAIQESHQFRILRALAINLITARHADAQVRRAMADTARAMDPVPASQTLFAAHAAATAECRRNATWTTSRGPAR